MNKLKIIAIVTLLSFSTFIIAVDKGGAGFEPSPYIGISLGSVGTDGFGVDDSEAGLILFGGYNLTENFAVEGGYSNLGDFSSSINFFGNTTTTNAETSALYIAAVGKMPINDKVHLRGRIGLAFWESDVSTTSNIFGTTSNSFDGTDLMFGIGASYQMSNKMNLIVDYTSFDLDGADANSLSVGVQFNLNN